MQLRKRIKYVSGKKKKKKPSKKESHKRNTVMYGGPQPPFKNY